MRRLAFALLLGLLLRPAFADPIALPVQQPPGLLCRQAIAAAARVHGVPPALMAAVGRVESGRRDPASGAMHPWPWTVDADGQGSFYGTKQQAIAAVLSFQANGVRSIDVGCMQVNLLHHPQAFASLDQAFDPSANADYAARFLVELHGQTGSWPKATAFYHSTTPELGAAYEQKVMQAWPLEERLVSPDLAFTMARAPSPILGPAFFPPPRRDSGPHVIPRVTPPTGSAQAGRGLASYRAVPIRPGWRRNGG
jgi:Transglycosylase SLT domain